MNANISVGEILGGLSIAEDYWEGFGDVVRLEIRVEEEEG